MLLPERYNRDHEKHVTGYFSKPAMRPMGDVKRELFGIRKNGEEFPVDISLSYFDTYNGRVAVSTIRDITDKNRLNKETANSERVLREITSVMPAAVYQAIFTTDSKIIFTFLSDGARAIMGLEPDEVYRDSAVLFARVHPADLPRVMAIIADSNAMGTKFFHSFRIVMNDGGVKWLQATGVPKKEADGTVVRTGYFSDVTQAKNAEKMLEESNEKYRTILEKTEEMINTLSPDAKIIWANSAWKKNLQYGDVDLSQGLALFDVITERSKEGFGERIQRLRSGDTIRGLRATLIAKDGSNIDAIGTIVPIFDEGKFIGTQAFFRNVTELNKERTERIKAETRWQHTVDNMLTGCTIIGYDWTYLYMNKAAAKQAFRKPEEVIGRTMQETTPGVEYSNVFAMYALCV
jgi:PAS domain S-box-containing protein